MERRSWENATSPLKDPNRAPDPSTLRRWVHELDSSRPASSFLRPLVQTAAQWLARGEQHAFGSLHLSWPTIYPCLRVFWPWDFPSPDHYLPKPLSLEEDQQLQQQLRLADTLEVNALRLMRATGIRISKCINLPLDCLQQISEQQVALCVPLCKLHSERLVPVDEETQHVVARMVELGALPRAVGRWWRAHSCAGGPSFLTASLLATWHLVQGATRYLSRCGPGCWLHWSGQPTPATALLRNRNGAPGRQPARAYANDGTQRHPHDPALCGSGPARSPT